MTKKLILALILPFLSISSLFADFFAFRKLTDPKTGNIVYLLYDAHATIDHKPESTISMKKELKKSGKLVNECDQNSLNTWKQDAEKEYIKIRANFTNLTKQHNDLVKIISTITFLLLMKTGL